MPLLAGQTAGSKPELWVQSLPQRRAPAGFVLVHGSFPKLETLNPKPYSQNLQIPVGDPKAEDYSTLGSTLGFPTYSWETTNSGAKNQA